MSGTYGGFLMGLSGSHSIVVGGLCRPGCEPESVANLQQLAGWEINVCDDPQSIDQQLETTIQPLCTDHIWAIGASIHVPDVSGKGGGIIGSPHRSGQAAKGGLEYLGHGLYQVAHAGGPGCVLACTPAQADFLDWPNMAGVHPKWVAHILLSKGIADFLVVSDGSGPGAHGEIQLCINGCVQGMCVP